ncbi:MAG: hypothetical protein ABIG71_04285, partial [Candidatus Uhrbacteria bacterium]
NVGLAGAGVNVRDYFLATAGYVAGEGDSMTVFQVGIPMLGLYNSTGFQGFERPVRNTTEFSFHPRFISELVWNNLPWEDLRLLHFPRAGIEVVRSDAYGLDKGMIPYLFLADDRIISFATGPLFIFSDIAIPLDVHVGLSDLFGSYWSTGMMFYAERGQGQWAVIELPIRAGQMLDFGDGSSSFGFMIGLAIKMVFHLSDAERSKLDSMFKGMMAGISFQYEYNYPPSVWQFPELEGKHSLRFFTSLGYGW